MWTCWGAPLQFEDCQGERLHRMEHSGLLQASQRHAWMAGISHDALTCRRACSWLTESHGRLCLCNACQDGAPTPPPSARSSRKRHNLADFRSLLRLLCESLHITYSELPYRSVGVFRHDIRWSNPLERAAAGEHHVVRVLCETMREEGFEYPHLAGGPMSRCAGVVDPTRKVVMRPVTRARQPSNP